MCYAYTGKRKGKGLKAPHVALSQESPARDRHESSCSPACAQTPPKSKGACFAAACYIHTLSTGYPPTQSRNARVHDFTPGAWPVVSGERCCWFHVRFLL